MMIMSFFVFLGSNSIGVFDGRQGFAFQRIYSLFTTVFSAFCVY